MLPILRQSIKFKIRPDAAHPPGFRHGFKRPQHHFPCVLLVIRAFIRHPQHRQIAQIRNRLCHQIEMLARMQRQRHT